METKAMLRGEAALVCPTIFKPSRAKDKYLNATMYLLTYHGVLAPQVRDLFTAGSVAGPERGGDYLIRSLQGNASQILRAASEIDDDVLKAYWGMSCRREHRIAQWLDMADRYRPLDPPSRHLKRGLT